MKNNKLKDKDKQKLCGGVKVKCSNYSTPENTMDKIAGINIEQKMM